jgi:hypothetical protein
MNLLKAATTVCCMTLMGPALTPRAKADDWNKKTVITFSGPVEIPAVHLTGWGVLPAGTYVFKVLDSQSDRHIIQIFSRDEKTCYATILAISNYRLKSTNKTAITFRERPTGEPEALRAWFYPGKNWGEEFVYPRSKAIALAKDANTAVLFTAVEFPLEVAEPITSADAPVVVALKQAPIMAVQPTGEEVQLAEVVTPPPAETEMAMAAPVAETIPTTASPVAETVPATASPVAEPLPTAASPVAEPLPTTASPVAETLPDTASPLPLVALFGLLALAGVLALRVAEKRV